MILWAPVAAVLAKDHLVIVPDRRGMGLPLIPKVDDLRRSIGLNGETITANTKHKLRNHRTNLGDSLSNNADYVSGICDWQQEQKWTILTVDKQ